MNVWKSIIIGLTGVWLLTGCGGSSEGSQDEMSLKEYFSRIELYRVCLNQEAGYYDGLWMSDTADSVNLITVNDEGNAKSEYTYGLRIGTDRVWLTDEAGDEDECLVVRETNATQFQCTTAGTSDWYHTVKLARENPTKICKALPDSSATKAFKQLLLDKPLYSVDLVEMREIFYFSSNGSYEKNTTDENGADYGNEHGTFKIKDDMLDIVTPSIDYHYKLTASDNRSITLEYLYPNLPPTFRLWKTLEDAVDHPQ